MLPLMPEKLPRGFRDQEGNNIECLSEWLALPSLELVYSVATRGQASPNLISCPGAPSVAGALVGRSERAAKTRNAKHQMAAPGKQQVLDCEVLPVTP